MNAFAAHRRAQVADPPEAGPPPVPKAPGLAPAPALPPRPPKALSIDSGVALEGQIRDCDLVQVGGDVRGEIVDSKALMVVEAGRFDGRADVAECEVAGELVGTLVVRGRLTIRASGRVSGTIQYASIAIERGGRLAGTVALCDAEADPLKSIGRPTLERWEDRAGSADQAAHDLPAISGPAAR